MQPERISLRARNLNAARRDSHSFILAFVQTYCRLLHVVTVILVYFLLGILSITSNLSVQCRLLRYNVHLTCATYLLILSTQRRECKWCKLPSLPFSTRLRTAMTISKLMSQWRKKQRDRFDFNRHLSAGKLFSSYLLLEEYLIKRWNIGICWKVLLLNHKLENRLHPLLCFHTPNIS